MAVDAFGTACAASALFCLFSAIAAPASAAGWQPAGTAAGRIGKPSAAAPVVTLAAWQVRGGDSVAPTPAGEDAQFDPFEESFDDQAAAMPATEPQVAPPVNAPADEAQEAVFDPFEMDSAAEHEPAVGRSEEARTGQGGRSAHGGPAGNPRDAGDAFDVQGAFDEPRRGSVGPSVEDQLEGAEEAVDEEIDRREGGNPTPEDGDEVDPFSPEDAIDAPERDAEDVFPGPNDEQDEDQDQDAGDNKGAYQQGAGEFDIRPMNEQPELTPEQQEERRQELERERLENEQTCEEFLAAVRADDIKTVSLDIRMHGLAGEDYPFDCGLGDELFQPRAWPQITYLWKASGLCHKPLYFEQRQMERYGHSWGPALDPIVSGVHFFGTFPVLPYKMGIMTPNECVYTLGYYRPGSCAPYMIEAVPFTWRAAAFEAGAWTGGAFAIP